MKLHQQWATMRDHLLHFQALTTFANWHFFWNHWSSFEQIGNYSMGTECLGTNWSKIHAVNRKPCTFAWLTMFSHCWRRLQWNIPCKFDDHLDLPLWVCLWFRRLTSFGRSENDWNCWALWSKFSRAPERSLLDRMNDKTCIDLPCYVWSILRTLWVFALSAPVHCIWVPIRPQSRSASYWYLTRCAAASVHLVKLG